MKKLQVEEWTTDADRKLFRRLSADQYEVSVYSCTETELAELGAAIADALAVQPAAPLREMVFRCRECGLTECMAGHTLALPPGWNRDGKGCVTCPDCGAENVVE